MKYKYHLTSQFLEYKLNQKSLVHPLPLRREPQLTTFPSLGTFVPKCWGIHSTINRTNQPILTHTHHNNPTPFLVYFLQSHNSHNNHSKYWSQPLTSTKQLPHSNYNTILNLQYPGTNQINTTRWNKYTTIQLRVQ